MELAGDDITAPERRPVGIEDEREPKIVVGQVVGLNNRARPVQSLDVEAVGDEQSAVGKEAEPERPAEAGEKGKVGKLRVGDQVVSKYSSPR